MSEKPYNFKVIGDPGKLPAGLKWLGSGEEGTYKLNGPSGGFSALGSYLPSTCTAGESLAQAVHYWDT